MIPEPIQKLIDAHRKVRDRLNFAKSLRHLSVSKVATLAGSTYESMRNSIELEQDHLLRRRAIRRMLIRMGAIRSGDPVHRAEDLLKEISWGKYTKHNPVPEMAIESVGKIISKYQTLAARYYAKFGKKVKQPYADDLYDILSFEIERVILPYFDKDALINIQYSNLVALKLTRANDLPEKYEPIQTYINVIRSVNKFDDAMIKFYMFSNAFPYWKQPTSNDIDTVVMRLINTLKDIRSHLEYQLPNRKFKEFIRQSIPLKILNRTIDDNIDKVESFLDDKPKRDEFIAQTCEREYNQIRRKIRITIVKTVIYLAATKMIFAFLVEVPYEMWAHQRVDYIPLAINIIFPPILMAIIANSFSIPAKANTQAIINVVDRLMDPSGNKFINDGLAFTRRRPFLYFIFKSFSYMIFIAVMVGVSYSLKLFLNFNYVSIAIFILFVSLVSFGAFKIRNIATELIIIPVRSSIFTPLIDMVAVPIISLGKRLSDGVAHLSPIPFVFDNVLESPFKGFLRFFEEWNTYVRDQRDDIV